jgi:hypothetical protein
VGSHRPSEGECQLRTTAVVVNRHDPPRPATALAYVPAVERWHLIAALALAVMGRGHALWLGRIGSCMFRSALASRHPPSTKQMRPKPSATRSSEARRAQLCLRDTVQPCRARSSPLCSERMGGDATGLRGLSRERVRHAHSILLDLRLCTTVRGSIGRRAGAGKHYSSLESVGSPWPSQRLSSSRPPKTESGSYPWIDRLEA